MPNPTSSTEADLIGSRESATILRVDRATFNRWVAAGRISAVVTGPGRTGGRLFNREDVEKLAAALKTDEVSA